MIQKSISFLIFIIISLQLCAFFISSTIASKTLKGDEFAKINQCEKKFWWKSRKSFQKDLADLCMKQQYDHHDKYKKRFHKSKNCDKSESWNFKDWSNKKGTWENLDDGKYKSLDNAHWKKSQKLLWKKFQEVADCKCSVLNYKLTNPAGISVCHQIVSLNKSSGDFIGVFTVFRSLKYDKFKKSVSIAVKYNKNVKVKISGLKKNRNDNLIDLKPLFTFKTKDFHGNKIFISKAFIKGKVPSKSSMNKLNIDDISPIKYKATVKIDKVTKKIFALKLGADVKNIPISKFTPSAPFFPYLVEEPIKNDPAKKKKPNDKNKITTTSQNSAPNLTSTNLDPNLTTPTDGQSPDPNATAPTDGQSSDPNATAPTDSQSPDPNATAPTDGQNLDPNQPTPTDQVPNAQDTQSVNADGTSSIANPTASNVVSDSNVNAADQGVPGSTISAAPVGLIVFSVVVALGAAFVGYTTYERRRYRNQFNRRQNIQQQNPSLAAVPEFGRAI